jgi:hypothetical protein
VFDSLGNRRLRERDFMELMIESEIVCPHCGESFPLLLDTSLPEQAMIEDCTVCCRPIALRVRARPGEVLDLQIS